MLRRGFAFFNGKISPKTGSKCCRYGLNGIPFNQQQVDTFKESMKGLIEGWSISEGNKSLYRFFYSEDYLGAIEFVNNVVSVDQKTTQNQPEFHITNGNLVKVELTSHTLKGLSQVDFELASRINGINFEDLNVIPVSSDKRYRAEVRMIVKKKEDERILKQLAETEGINSKKKMSN